MEYPAIEINLGILDGLFLEEIMGHKLDVYAGLLFRVSNHIGQLLYDQVEVWVLSSQSKCRIAVRST